MHVRCAWFTLGKGFVEAARLESHGEIRAVFRAVVNLGVEHEVDDVHDLVQPIGIYRCLPAIAGLSLAVATVSHIIHPTTLNTTFQAILAAVSRTAVISY